MSEYTPGPWKYEYDYATDTGADHAIVGADGSIVTYMDGDGDSLRVAADARLAAAAPELLALLVELADIEGPQPGHVEWYRKVQAAIANATREDS